MDYTKKLVAILITIVYTCCFCFSADTAVNADSTWTLAAAAFTATSLPAAKQSSGALVPLLLLEEIKGLSFHSEQLDEKTIAAADLQRDERVKAINSLQTLYTSRDKLLFSVLAAGDLQSKYNDVEKKIATAEKALETVVQGTDSSDSDTSNTSEKTEKKKIVLWSSGEKKASAQLASIDNKKAILPQMKKAKISGLLTGTIEPVGSYMRITCRLYVQPHAEPIAEIVDAGSWEMIDKIVHALALQLLPHLYGGIPAQVLITVTPSDASAVVDGDPIETGVPVMLYPGKHSFVFNKDGYFSSTETYTLEPEKKYRLSVSLEEQNLRTISYAKKETTETVIFEGFNPPVQESDFALPTGETIGYAENAAGDNAWFIIPKTTFPNETESTQAFSAELNNANINETITRRRNIMYWSLGALYLFLPVSMYYNGTYDNMVVGYNNGCVTDIDEINRITTISNVTTVIGWCLGINFAVQLVRYMITVNKLTPPVLDPIDPADIFTTVTPATEDGEDPGEIPESVEPLESVNNETNIKSE